MNNKIKINISQIYTPFHEDRFNCTSFLQNNNNNNNNDKNALSRSNTYYGVITKTDAGEKVSVHDCAVVRLDTILSNSNAATKKDVQKENSRKKSTVV